MEPAERPERSVAEKVRGKVRFGIDLLPLRCHFRSRVMGQTQLFVGTFLCHPSPAAEPVLVKQT